DVAEAAEVAHGQLARLARHVDHVAQDGVVGNAHAHHPKNLRPSLARRSATDSIGTSFRVRHLPAKGVPPPRLKDAKNRFPRAWPSSPPTGYSNGQPRVLPTCPPDAAHGAAKTSNGVPR